MSSCQLTTVKASTRLVIQHCFMHHTACFDCWCCIHHVLFHFTINAWFILKSLIIILFRKFYKIKFNWNTLSWLCLYVVPNINDMSQQLLQTDETEIFYFSYNYAVIKYSINKITKQGLRLRISYVFELNIAVWIWYVHAQTKAK